MDHEQFLAIQKSLIQIFQSEFSQFKQTIKADMDKFKSLTFDSLTHLHSRITDIQNNFSLIRHPISTPINSSVPTHKRKKTNQRSPAKKPRLTNPPPTDVCWYHDNFGLATRFKCPPPCPFSQQLLKTEHTNLDPTPLPGPSSTPPGPSPKLVSTDNKRITNKHGNKSFNLSSSSSSTTSSDSD